MKIANAPSISIGAIHGPKKEPIFRKSYGLRTVEPKLEADADTAYMIGNCSQMVTCAAIGVLVGDKKLAWDDLVRKHLPAFDPQGDPEIREKATIIDICRHSTGLGNPTTIFAGPGGTIFNTVEDHTALVNALPTADKSGQRLQKSWCYSNAAFGLLAQIIETVSGMPFAEFLQKRIFQPLKISQTNVRQNQSDGVSNIALPYLRLPDGTWSKIETGMVNQGHGPYLASMGMSSSVNDMLTFLAAIMNQYDVECGAKSPHPLIMPKSKNPLQQIGPMWNNWWALPVDDGFENGTVYALGWYRTTMPSAALGMGSHNRHADIEQSFLNPKTIIGKESEPRTLYGCNGVANGFVATAYVFPHDHTAIVALCNAANAGDAAETVSRIMIQALFKPKPRVSAFQPLRDARSRCLKAHESMMAEWQLGRDPTRFTGTAKDYVGSYVGLSTVHISIVATDGDDNTNSNQMAVVFGDNPPSKCILEPYNSNMLSFLPVNRDILLSRGMLAWTNFKMGIFEFVRDEDDGEVAGFWWQWGPNDYPSLWVRDQAGMGPQQVQEVLDKFGYFQVEEQTGQDAQPMECDD